MPNLGTPPELEGQGPDMDEVRLTYWSTVSDHTRRAHTDEDAIGPS